MNVIGLHRQFQNRPALFLALTLDQFAALLRHVADKDRLPPFGAPDKVVDDKVDPVFVALVLHTCIVDNNNVNDKTQPGLKPKKSPYHRR